VANMALRQVGLISPPQRAAELLDLFRSAGGVVDYILFEKTPTPVSDVYALHKEAAVRGMFELLVDPLVHSSSGCHLSNPSNGKRISVREWMGDLYDWEKHRLLELRTVAEYGASGERQPSVFAYAYAFSQPVYNAGLPELPDPSALFGELNAQLFGELTDDLDIRVWPDDWSSYFESGKEYWGTFFWTVIPPRMNHIVVVAASTTD
jgi:hypothetical protein